MSLGLRIIAVLLLAISFPSPAASQLPTVNRRALEMRKAINLQIQQASPAVKTKIEAIPVIEAPHPTPTPTPVTTTPPPPPLVSPEQKSMLLGKILEFQSHANSEERKYSGWATITIVGIAALSLAASLLSFASRNKVGGGLGLIVVAIVAITNTYPIVPLSDFYRSLAAQANALKLECDLKDPFTVEAYNSAADQLKLLIVYEGDKRPQLGSSKAVIDDLTQQLQVYKSSGTP